MCLCQQLIKRSQAFAQKDFSLHRKKIRYNLNNSGGGAVWISALEWGSRGRGFKSRPPEICKNFTFGYLLVIKEKLKRTLELKGSLREKYFPSNYLFFFVREGSDSPVLSYCEDCH